MPDEIKEVTFKTGGMFLRAPITHVLKEAGLVSSTSEAIRMIKQGAVKMDGEKISDPTLMLDPGSIHVYQVGKRKFARVTVG
jgi:tyrosyl-tRNA synthetase